jgi:FAD binding domain
VVAVDDDDRAVVQRLEGVFAGELVAPGDARYETVRRVWNGMVDRRPAVIARCAGQEGVVAALRFARERGLPVAIRGGGHNVAGNAVCDGGVVIDLSAQKAIHVDPAKRTARAQPWKSHYIDEISDGAIETIIEHAPRMSSPLSSFYFPASRRSDQPRRRGDRRFRPPGRRV